MNLVVLHDAGTGTWLRFSDPVEVIETCEPGEVRPSLVRIEEAVNSSDLHAAGFLSYEASPAFDDAFRVRHSSGFPLMSFGLYRPPEIIILPEPSNKNTHTLGEWRPTVSRDEYAGAIRRIKEHIAEGDTYQVNYSFRLRTEFSGDPWELFLHLARAQQSLYCVFVESDRFAICSASPELFFQLEGDRLTTRPMKGTVRRGLTYRDDQDLGRWLGESEKNRSENVMIVDMMRNDVGRVALASTVAVQSLFHVERYPTLWQMTSTVSGTTESSVASIIGSLFPCASITGAPKARTMDIIAEIESTPRGIYTGCIGYIAPQRRAQFNVAIRTVRVDKTLGEAEYGVGGGIVWSSTPEDEYSECLQKAKVLAKESPVFSLFETMLWTPDDGYFLIEEHLQRLEESAQYFGYRCDARELRRLLDAAARSFPALPQKVRALISPDGSLRIEHGPVFPRNGHQVRVRLATSPVDHENVFLYHKTTHRVVYEQALMSCSDCDDVLLWNSRGEITESTIANIVVGTKDGLVTPPVNCGLLGGTFRARLIRKGEISEQVVTIDDLKKSKALYLVNSVSQWRPAKLLV